MKYHFLAAALFLFCGFAQAQQSEEEQVKQVVTDFFDAFHKKDTVTLKTMAVSGAKMESIGKNKEGEVVLSKGDYQTFLERMAGMSPDMKFKEELTGYEIKVDGPMANAWTPYKFWLNGELSHCGVNSFQMIKQDGEWKIFYVVDTRRRENCAE